MNVAVFPVPSFDGVQSVFAEAKSHLGEILSAFEFFDKQSVSSACVRDAGCLRGSTTL